LEDNGPTSAESGVYFQIAENAEYWQFSVRPDIRPVPHRGTYSRENCGIPRYRQIFLRAKIRMTARFISPIFQAGI
jgi:hypothetical protein